MPPLVHSLSSAWAGQARWCVLDAGRFDRGRLLHAWQAWRTWQGQAAQPRVLHLVAFASGEASLGPLAAATDPWPDLAQALAAQWWGLTPGMHRLSFEEGRVTLTLCVGDPVDHLRELSLTADTLWLDGAGPLAGSIKPLSRLCRRGTLIAATSDAALPAADLRSAGFRLQEGAREGVFDPAWTPRRLRGSPLAPAPGCVVVGSGLAGAAVARSLALRGWPVQVIDAAPEPAAGASSLPAGLLVPHLSPDDNLLSRLSRAGVRNTLAQAAALLQEGRDWGRGVLEHRIPKPGRSQTDDPSRPARREPLLSTHGMAADWSRPASDHEKALAGLAQDAPAVWHAAAGWIRPAALVRAWLNHPGITWRGGQGVARLVPAYPAGTAGHPAAWQLLDAQGVELARAPLVVLAAALGCRDLSAGSLWLHPVRGQVSCGTASPGLDLPACAVNGQGHLLPQIPGPHGGIWMTGATYGRGDIDLQVRRADHDANLARLERLLPDAARALAPAFASGEVRGWTGVRCTSHDRRPLVGALAPGLWVTTAMGSRGLTFAALCGELLAARLHDEPLPLPQSLAAALDLARANPGRDRSE